MLRRYPYPAAFAVLIALTALLQACASLGLPRATSFEERLAVGYVSVTTVRESALTLLRAEAITVEDAENVQAQADNARAALDIARGLRSVDFEAADQRLASALVILEALQRYLDGRKP